MVQIKLTKFRSIKITYYAFDVEEDIDFLTIYSINRTKSKNEIKATCLSNFIYLPQRHTLDIFTAVQQF